MRYGLIQLKLSGFSWKLGINHFMHKCTRYHALALTILRICLKNLPTRLNRDIQHPADSNLLRPHIALYRGTGILTCFPSATHLCLTLGADSPCADERCAGNLGLSARELFTPFIATHVSIRTSDTSSNPHRLPSQAYRTLSYHAHIINNAASEASVTCLAPLHLPRRTTRLSELLRFL